MSLNDYYTVQVLAHQHHQELLADAANERLAAQARGGRLPWLRTTARRQPSRRRAAVYQSRHSTL